MVTKNFSIDWMNMTYANENYDEENIDGGFALGCKHSGMGKCQRI